MYTENHVGPLAPTPSLSVGSLADVKMIQNQARGAFTTQWQINDNYLYYRSKDLYYQ